MKMAYEFELVLDNDDNIWELPTPATQLSAGYDLRCYCPNTDALYVEINPGETVVLRTNVKVNIPPFGIGMVVSRSGQVARKGLMVANAPGIIDADYNGEICVIMHNISKEPQRAFHGERIAQIVFVMNDNISTRDGELPERTGGFGSTGVS
jgi:dUTP pyrophosphatase